MIDHLFIQCYCIDMWFNQMRTTVAHTKTAPNKTKQQYQIHYGGIQISMHRKAQQHEIFVRRYLYV